MQLLMEDFFHLAGRPSLPGLGKPCGHENSCDLGQDSELQEAETLLNGLGKQGIC